MIKDNEKEHLVQLLYNPGNYPTPMIAMYQDHNQNLFDLDYQYSFQNFDNNNMHIWTIDAYIIYNNEQVIAYRFNEFSNFLWLLRKINLPLKLKIDVNLFQKEIKNFGKEFETI